MKRGKYAGLGALLAVLPMVALAEDVPALDTGDTAWMIVATILVLFMTLPGLALFYSGMVRSKNVLSVMMQCFTIACLSSVLWMIYGYSLAFSDGGSLNSVIGGFDNLFLSGLTVDALTGTIPESVFITFQMTFAIITPALIVGAFAERMKFSAVVIFSALWLTVCYLPMTHMVWGGGWMGADGVLDFAGGTVVHISSGVSVLVAAILVGPRMGFPSEPHQPHNLTYTALGAAMLWIGWFGFNAGSELLSDDLTSSAFAVTHFAAAAGAVAWALTEWLLNRKPTVLGASSGAVSGLVCITPAAGFVQPMPALAMGAAAGILCYFACSSLKRRLGYDDALDAFGVHGVGGTLGAVLTGVFATRACWDIAEGQPLGLIEGNSQTIVGQIVAVLITYAFAAVGSYILLKVIDALIGLRVRAEVEQRGLDLIEHGEEAYTLM